MEVTGGQIPVNLILPAHDEAAYVGPCLDAVLASDLGGLTLRVIVVANGCADDTAARARAFAGRLAARGGALHVIETPVGNKLRALQLGDGAAGAGARLYLDADVIVSPGLIRALAEALQGDTPRYACGTPVVAQAQSPVTRAYARFWATLPFVTQGAPGFGLFAMNAAGRTRWGDWPDVISDDTFARLNFIPQERARLAQTYRWPMVEGFGPLVRVRRRQDRGVQEIAWRFPHLLRNDDKAAPGPGGIIGRALRDPAGFAVYAAVAVAVRLPARGEDGWARGR